MYVGVCDEAASPEQTVWVQWCGSNLIEKDDRERLEQPAQFRDECVRPGRIKVKA